ncbi:hypothetical protein, partial [Actinoplanes octamycinicus]
MTTELTAPRQSAGTATAPARPAYQLRLHQVIATQAAVVLVLIGVVTGGPALVAAVPGAAFVLALTWLRVRGRWAFVWLAAVLHLRSRRRAALRLTPADRPATGPPAAARRRLTAGPPRRTTSDLAEDLQLRTAAAILQLTAPDVRVTSTDLPDGEAALLADAAGLTMLLELGDPAALLAEARPDLPAPWELLPADARDRPPGRVQLLLAGVPAPTATAGTGPVGGSYRMLTEGRVLGHARAVLAVHMSYADGWSDSELRRALTRQVRRLARRLTAQPLDRPRAVRLFFDLSYADPAAPIHEDWTTLRTGDLSQATFHGRAPGGTGLSAELLARLLLLPATATTVTVTADLPAVRLPFPPPPGRPLTEPVPAEPPVVTLAVRLAARDPAVLDAAEAALRQLAVRERVPLHRRDGEHLPGLAATLPLALAGPEAPIGWHRPAAPSTAGDAFGRLAVPTGWAGLTVGRNRQGHPMLVRLFRPEHTRVLLVGGVRCAQLTAFRAMAIGARVLVRTHRPHDWAAFARSAAVPSGAIGIVPVDHPAVPPPGSPLHPVLTILDPDPHTSPPATAPPSGRPDGGDLATRPPFTARPENRSSFAAPPENRPPSTAPPENRSSFAARPENRPPFAAPPENRPPFTAPPANRSSFAAPPENRPPFTAPPESRSSSGAPPAGPAPGVTRVGSPEAATIRELASWLDAESPPDAPAPRTDRTPAAAEPNSQAPTGTASRTDQTPAGADQTPAGTEADSPVDRTPSVIELAVRTDW